MAPPMATESQLGIPLSLTSRLHRQNLKSATSSTHLPGVKNIFPMDMDKMLSSDEFLIICKYCQEVLPSIGDFIIHKNENHAEESQCKGSTTSIHAPVKQATRNNQDAPLLDETIPTSINQRIKIKFPFNKSKPLNGDLEHEVKEDNPDFVSSFASISSLESESASGASQIIVSEPWTVLDEPHEGNNNSADTETKSTLGIKGRKTGKKRKRWSVKGYRCSYCADIFDSFNAKRRHEWIHTRPFECRICFKGFPSKSAASVHANTVHNKKPGTVKTSKKGIQVKDSSTAVPTGPRAPKIYKCGECAYQTRHGKGMSVHRKRHTAAHPHKCPLCTCSFPSSNGLNLHIGKIHPDSEARKNFLLKIKVKKAKCQTKMGQSAKMKTKGVKKGTSVPGNIKPVFACKYCGKEERHASGLRRHEAIHILPHYCTHCPRRFSNKRDFKKHLVKVHHQRKLLSTVPRRHVGSLNALKDIRCPACGETLKGRVKLVQHLAQYHPSFKAYKCKECPFATSKRDTYQCHVRCHRGGDEYPCPHCTAAFSRMLSRDNHVIDVHPGMTTSSEISMEPKQPRRVAVHPTGYYNRIDEPLPTDNYVKNPSKCSKCEAVFKGNRKYEKHFKENHPGSKPYSCKDCAYETVSIRTMGIHEKLHIEDNEFKCNFCTASFINRQARSLHITSVHLVRGEGGNVTSEGGSEVSNIDTLDNESPEIILVEEAKNVVQHTGAKNEGLESPLPLQFTCKICSKNFLLNIALKMHEKVHSGNNQLFANKTKPYSTEASVPVVSRTNSIPKTSTGGVKRNLCVRLVRIDGIGTISKCSEDQPLSKIVTPPATPEVKLIKTPDKPIEPFRMRTRQSKTATPGPTPPPAKRKCTGIRIFVCTTCNDQFGRKTDFEAHCASKCGKPNEAKTTTTPNGCTARENPVSTPVLPEVEVMKLDMAKELKIGDTASQDEEKLAGKPFCHICLTTFAFPGHLKIHMKKAHKVKAPTKGQLCEFLFSLGRKQIAK